MSRGWRLKSYPHGEDFASALALEEIPVPTPAEGQVLVRSEFLSMDAGTRMWMTPRTDGYQPPVPLGSIMPGLVLGRVVESRHRDYAKGDLVRAFGLWADYSCLMPEASVMRKLDDRIDDPRQYLGALGLNAWTAYVGLQETAHARAGENVLISAAAGATGMLAAQIARIMGCRVIGLAGGAKKCRFLIDEIAVDQAIDYKSADVAKVLAEVPGGIHVYFDNVGGPLLDAVLPNMALHGRIAVCGLIAGYADEDPVPGPTRFDQVLMKRLTITGFFLPDCFHLGDAIAEGLLAWMREGRLRMPLDVTAGLENLLHAYAKLFTGGNLGKVLVKI
jgi:NADPH-dependent curcumin reductase CurA